jgi:hypothetical protein
MRLIPQIQLRTVFLLFLCAAIGLTCATAPDTHPDPAARASLRWHVANLDFCFALLSAATAAMVFGLLQQAIFLYRLPATTSTTAANLRFARRFAIAWRVALALLGAVCLLSKVLVVRQIVKLPEHEDYTPRELFPTTMIIICVLIVLSDCVRRWRQSRAPRSNAFLNYIAWICGAILLLLVLRDAGFLPYLVHIGIHGIENASAVKFQRPDVFPNHAAEHFRTFWISLSAAIVVMLTALLLFQQATLRMNRRRMVTGAVVYALLVAAAGAYCAWFFVREYPRISPEISSVGFASNWLDWLSGALVIVSGICAGAYRLSVSNDVPSTTDPEPTPCGDAIALHESVIWALCIVCATAVYYFENVSEYWTSPNWFGGATVSNFLTTYLREPEFYLFLALTALSLQFGWLRWRQIQPRECGLVAISPVSFGLNSLALAALAAVAIPTFGIYSFAYWFGPWYTFGPK